MHPLPPVTFLCTHCQKMMGVSAEYVGRQVRCPHCQQVVTAPAPGSPPVVPEAPAVPPVQAPSPPTPPGLPPTPAVTAPVFGPAPSDQLSFTAPFGPASAEEHESIFGEQVPDDLFADEPAVKLELPTDPGPIGAHPHSPGEPVYAGAHSAGPDAAHDIQANGTNGEAGWGAPEPLAAEPAAAPIAPRRVPSAQEGSTAIVWILSFLIPYALLMTATTLYFVFLQKQTPHPLEMLPDIGNDNTPTKKSGPKVQFFDRARHDQPLPPHLVTALNQPIRVGDLEVTPKEVVRKKLIYRSNRSLGDDDTPTTNDALVMTVTLKNVSETDAFDPTDPQFQKEWERGTTPPYTYLELTAGNDAPKRFYGGPLRFDKDRKGEQWWIEGQHGGRHDLQPGEAMTTVIATAATSKIESELKTFKGDYTWRIQFRRGFTQFRDKDYSTTAVVGVKFSAADIHTAKGG